MKFYEYLWLIPLFPLIGAVINGLVSNLLLIQGTFTGNATVQGNADILGEIAQTLVNFEIGFEILPGTAGPAGQVDLNPYEFESDDIWVSGE